MARGRKDGVRVTERTAAMMTLAAAQLNTTVAEMTERACVALLRHEARQLFTRELANANTEADAKRAPSIHAHEFERYWKPPAWRP